MKKVILLTILIAFLLAAGTSYAKRFLRALKRDKGAVPEDTRLQEKSFVHQGKKRSYLLFVPSDYSARKQMPLVLVFHGGGGNANAMAKRVRMHVIAEREKFIVAYPNGASRTGFGKNLSWNAGSVPPQGYSEKNNIDDVGFVKRLIGKLQSEYPIDNSRIHACGLSKGGMLCYRLACEMSATFASVAGVAAVMTADDCLPAQPVSILAIHGSADQNVPIGGGRGKQTGKSVIYPSVQETIRAWLTFNRCNASGEESAAAKDTRCLRYAGCDRNTEVVLCVIDGGGHGWPGTKPTRRQKRNDVYISPYFDANRTIWEFFKGHPKS